MMLRCVKCNRFRTRADSGQKRKCRSPRPYSATIYVDTRGGQWHGRVCPPCYRTRKANLARVTEKKVRPKEKMEAWEADPNLVLTHRRCRVCLVQLPKSRYFNCMGCVSLDSEHWMVTDFGVDCAQEAYGWGSEVDEKGSEQNTFSETT